MKIQVVALVAALTIVTTSTGCSGMRNFLFGRGAACGICPSQAPAHQAPTYLPPAAELGCGYEPSCGYEPGCGYEGNVGQAPRLFGSHRGCGLLGGGLCNGSSGCNCGSGPSHSMGNYGAHGFGGMVNDPYMMDGASMGSEFMSEPYNGYPQTIYNGPTTSGLPVGSGWQDRGSQPPTQAVPGNGSPN